MSEKVKKTFKSAKTNEEKNVILEKYSDSVRELTDEELDDIIGGVHHVIIPGDREGVLT